MGQGHPQDASALAIVFFIFIAMLVLAKKFATLRSPNGRFTFSRLFFAASLFPFIGAAILVAMVGFAFLQSSLGFGHPVKGALDSLREGLVPLALAWMVFFVMLFPSYVAELRPRRRATDREEPAEAPVPDEGRERIARVSFFGAMALQLALVIGVAFMPLLATGLLMIVLWIAVGAACAYSQEARPRLRRILMLLALIPGLVAICGVFMIGHYLYSGAQAGAGFAWIAELLLLGKRFTGMAFSGLAAAFIAILPGVLFSLISGNRGQQDARNLAARSQNPASRA